MPTDYRKEWLGKSSIDYFSPFVSLWLACNSWYLSHYSEIQGADRIFINKIKNDFSGRNHLFGKFSNLIEKQDKTGIAFRTNLEILHYSLERANLMSDKIGPCSFLHAVIDYERRTTKTNLIRTPRLKFDGTVPIAEDAPNVIKLDQIYITNDKMQFFSGLFEIIYQVRNMLVHGKLNPDKNEHEVVKYCYLILWDLMN